MVEPSGLQPMPFDSVTPVSMRVIRPSPSSRYSAAPPGRSPAEVVPAQNRPAGSQAPSLNCWSSVMSAGRIGPPTGVPPGPVSRNPSAVAST